MHPTPQKVGAFADRHGLFEHGPLTVGFSGGPDSTALALAMATLGLTFRAVHFDHGLRGEESDADAAWCQTFCEARGIPIQTVKLMVPLQKVASESVEMAARRLRLDYWSGIDGTVCLGHHLNDALETFLLRLCRGANASSLAGLQPKSEVRSITLARPLLCLSREEITAFVADCGIVPRHDASNDDVDIQRNLVRNEIVPKLVQLAGGEDALFKTVQFTAEDAACLDETAAAFNGVPSAVTLHERPWPIAYRILRNWVYAQDVEPALHLTGACSERLRNSLASPQPILVDMDDAWFLRIGGDAPLRLISKTPKPPLEPILWKWREVGTLCIQGRHTLRIAEGAQPQPNALFEDFATDVLPETLVVRERRPGDMLVPFGKRSPKSLKKLVSDAKISPDERERLLVLTTLDEQIVWVPGVRRAEFGRLPSSDAPAIRIIVEK